MEEINSFFDHTPQDGVAYIVIQHLSADFKSRMAELLARHSKLEIKEAQNHTPVKSNVVYLIPKEEKDTAELREQFIAILGHDLRNPVGAVNNVAQLMLRMPLDDRMKKLATILQDSSFRMRELIENVLDFARGRLGGGIPLERQEDVQVEELVRQVVAELELVWPGRLIETKFDLVNPVNTDGKRIAQLFSNLLGNSLNYGAKDKPVVVEAKSEAGNFTLTVSNAGKKIPEKLMANLFKPFSRGEVKPGQGGLGLGLYISAEIARAHGGSLTVLSNDECTSFTLYLPNKR